MGGFPLNFSRLAAATSVDEIDKASALMPWDSSSSGEKHHRPLECFVVDVGGVDDDSSSRAMDSHLLKVGESFIGFVG
jgi:hypothetical protein